MSWPGADDCSVWHQVAGNAIMYGRLDEGNAFPLFAPMVG
jgi:hypothetical protein